MLPTSTWPQDLSWSVVDKSSDIPLEKNDFPFENSYQIVSRLRMGPHVFFPLLVLGHHLT